MMSAKKLNWAIALAISALVVSLGTYAFTWKIVLSVGAINAQLKQEQADLNTVIDRQNKLLERLLTVEKGTSR